jgi:hypothetical protein
VAEHVLAETRYAAAAPPQHCVGLRRSIAADNFNRLLRIGFALYFPNQVDEVRVHAGLFATPPVAQEPVKLLQRALVVTPVALVRDRDVFAGMKMMHRNGSRIALGDRVLQRLRAEDENEQRQTDRINGACREQSTSTQLRVVNVH